MMQLRTIAICVIAVILVAHFYVEHIHPRILVTQNEHRYYELARQCHEAASEMERWRDQQEQLDPETLGDLHRVSTVAMMDCYSRDHLRLDLLSKGVREVDLNLIDLRARKDSTVSIPYFVKVLGLQE